MTTRRAGVAAAVLWLVWGAGHLLRAGPGQAAPPAAAGLTVALLLDVSASMTHQPLGFDPRYAQVFNAFLEGLKPGDRAAVGVIADRVQLGRVTADRRELSNAVRWLLQVPDAARLGASPLWDALDEVLPLVADPARRSAIVLFSDGKASGNHDGLDEVIEHARRLGVSISIVVEGPGSDSLGRTNPGLDPADALEHLAQQTGGRRLLDRPLNPRQRNPGPLIALIMEGLHR